jgi:glycosyltransferase involved in cell wall biosynthesis
MPRVSVIIPAYNHEKYVAETLQSVFAQTYRDYELLIIDDASTDQTVNVIKQFYEPRMKLFCLNKNQGGTGPLNYCVKQAQGEFIAIVNSDDAWFEHKLEKQVLFLDAHPETGAVFTYPQYINENSEYLPDGTPATSRVFLQPNRTRFEWLRHFFFFGNCLCHPTVLIRKKCYEEIGLYDERLFQTPDFDMWVRLCMKYEIHILQEKLIKFRIRDNGENVSAPTPAKISRTEVEFIQLLDNYLRPEIHNSLFKIFGQELQNVPPPPQWDIFLFYIAILATQARQPAHWHFGLFILYRIMKNETTKQFLAKHYNFDHFTLFKIAGEKDMFGFFEKWALQQKLGSGVKEML